jgi:hypothetical protein
MEIILLNSIKPFDKSFGYAQDWLRANGVKAIQV